MLLNKEIYASKKNFIIVKRQSDQLLKHMC